MAIAVRPCLKPARRFFQAVLAVALLTAAGSLRAQTVPSMIDAQGMVRDNSGNPINGTMNLTFSIFNTPTGGIALWTETQPGVQLNGGIFSTQLGRLSPIPLTLFINTALYVEINAGGQTLSPRQRLITAPYSVNSQYVQGHDTSIYVMKDAGTGFYGIGAAPPSTMLHVKKPSAGASVFVDNSVAGGTLLQLLGTGNGATLSLKADTIFSSGALNFGNGQNTFLRTDLGGSQVVIGGTTVTPGIALDVLGGNAGANQLCLGADCRSDVSDCELFSSCPGGYTLVAAKVFGSASGPFFCCRQ